MSPSYTFIHWLPGNNANRKRTFIWAMLLLTACLLIYILLWLFWSSFANSNYLILLNRVQTTSLIVGIGVLITLPFLYFMQDWNQPSLGITEHGLFINQQLIRNTLVPFSNIENIEKVGDFYKINFVNYKQVVAAQLPFFKFFVEYNLQNHRFWISSLYTAGDLDAFFVALQERLT